MLYGYSTSEAIKRQRDGKHSYEVFRHNELKYEAYWSETNPMPWQFPSPWINPNFSPYRPPSPISQGDAHSSTPPILGSNRSALIPPPPPPPPLPFSILSTPSSPYSYSSPGYSVEITMTEPSNQEDSRQPASLPPLLPPRAGTPPEEKRQIALAKQQSIAEQARRQKKEREEKEMKASRQAASNEEKQVYDTIAASQDSATQEEEVRMALALERSRKPARGRDPEPAPPPTSTRPKLVKQPSRDFGTQTEDPALQIALQQSAVEAQAATSLANEDEKALQAGLDSSLQAFAEKEARRKAKGWQGYDNPKRKGILESEWNAFRVAEVNAGYPDPEEVHSRGSRFMHILNEASSDAASESSSDSLVRRNPDAPRGMLRYLQDQKDVQMSGGRRRSASTTTTTEIVYRTGRDRDRRSRQMGRSKEDAHDQVSKPKRRVRFMSPADARTVGEAKPESNRYWSPGPGQRRRQERAMSPAVVAGHEDVRRDIQKGRGFTYGA